MPSLNSDNRGDLLVKVIVKIPDKPDKKTGGTDERGICWLKIPDWLKREDPGARHAKKWFQIVSQNLIYKKHLIKFPE